MIRLVFILIFLKGILFGCALCSIYTPKTHVTTSIKADKTHIKTLDINWIFAAEFTKELMQLYDLDLDGKFNAKELKLIEDALIAYLETKNFLTTITYAPSILTNENKPLNQEAVLNENIKKESNDFQVKSYKMVYKNGILSFDYSIDLDYKIYDKNSLFIHIFDNENYFFIIFDEKKQLFNIPYKISKKTNLNDVTFTIDAPTLSTFEKEEALNKVEIQKQLVQDKIVDEQIKILEKEQVVEEKVKEESLLDKFTHNVKVYLVNIEKGEDKWALLFLLIASFLYGVLHALGPGHGKALAFSYFSSQKSSYFQAFIISLATAFVHIIGALILVLISVFVLQSVLNKFMENSVTYITAFSAVVIMLLSLYILYRKLANKTHACCSCNINLNTTSFSINSSNMNFIKTNANKPILDTKRSKKQDLLFVIIAGIVPCPGTVLLFVYAFLLKTYFSVFLASISISLGMALVIFASSFLGVSLNKASAKSTKIVNIVEIVAPIFMFILGLLLLLNSSSFK
jgi:ABC-type nickel/cobalt efflux system permease component RcnA